MRNSRPIALIVLLVAAVLTSWWVYLLRQKGEPAPLVGPPRSDYQLQDFELRAFDEQGQESFHAAGPQLSRHPFLGTLELERPQLSFPARDSGAPWTATSRRVWINAEGDELRMIEDVRIDRISSVESPEVHLRSDALTVFPDARRASSDVAVTIQASGSILRGRGMRAEFDARRVELLSEVTARYEPLPP